MYNNTKAKCINSKKTLYKAVNYWLSHLKRIILGQIALKIEQGPAYILYNDNVTNFISMLSYFLTNPSIDISYKLNTHNESMLVNNWSFNLSNFFIVDINNGQNFDKFIANCKLVNEKLPSNAKAQINAMILISLL